MSLTLFNEFKILAGTRIDILDKDNNPTTTPVATAIERIRLLSLGYLRLHFDATQNIQYEDIGSILYQYVAIPIEFSASFFTTEKTSQKYHQNSLIMFQTEFSHDSTFVKHLLNTNNNNNNHNNKKHSKLQFSKLRLKLAVNDCNESIYGKIGYEIQYGLIELPKIIYNKQNNNEFEFSKQIQDRLTKLTIDESINLQYVMGSSVFAPIEYYKDLNSYYLFVGCIDTPEYWTTFGKNQKWSYVKLYQSPKYDDDYCLKTNDYIDMCFEKDKETNDIFMYYVKNNDILIKPKNFHKRWQRGRFKLDLKNNYYYIGLASVMCTCDSGGIKFEMTIQGA